MLEYRDLSKFKAQEKDTSRLFVINEHSYRSKFQRDRDRVIYAKEFRRLSGKTQIFVTGSDDNMRTRLTHTLEVAQIAETIAVRLKLDSMLTRAIAMGHDIGHTPFGHVGERTLNYIMNGCYPYYGYNEELYDEEKGFKHNLQGVRVACFLENNLDDNSEGCTGLNLTKYTLWGIKNHSSLKYKECEFCKNHKECRYKNCGTKCDGKLSVGFYEVLPYSSDERRDWTFEGIVVSCSDEIAQRHHDIEDGIYAGIIDLEHLCDYLLELFSYDDEIIKSLNDIKSKSSNHTYGYKSIAIQRLSRLIVDIYVTSYSNDLLKKVSEIVDIIGIDIDDNCLWKEKIFYYLQDKHQKVTSYFGFNGKLKEVDEKLCKYLSNHILYSGIAQSMDGKASYIIRQLVKAYLTNPQQLLDGTIISITRDWCMANQIEEKNAMPYMTEASKARQRLKDLLRKDDPNIKTILLRRICDHIAGMTDQYAMTSFERLYGSKEYNYRS